MNPVPWSFAQSFYSNVKKYLQFGQKMKKVLLVCMISRFNPSIVGHLLKILQILDAC